jgi:hypothetical protein
MSHRDQLHRRYKRTRDIDDWRAFKTPKISQITLKAAEKQHVRTEVNLHKDYSRSLWKVINRCIPSKDKIILTYHKNTLEVANDINQGRIQDFSYVSQSFRMYNLVLRAANARGT